VAKRGGGRDEALHQRGGGGERVESPVPARHLQQVVHRSLGLKIFSGGGRDGDWFWLLLHWYGQIY
jgi:hypothetical protein